MPWSTPLVLVLVQIVVDLRYRRSTCFSPLKRLRWVMLSKLVVHVTGLGIFQ